MTTRAFNRRVKGPSPQPSLRRWRARARLIHLLESLAVIAICVMGSAVLVMRAQEAWTEASGWHPVPSMDPFVAQAEPAAPLVSTHIHTAAGAVIPVAIHPPIRIATVRSWAARNRTFAAMLLAALAHRNGASQAAGSGGASTPTNGGTDAQPATAALTHLQPTVASALDLVADAAVWSGHQLMRAYDQAVVFVSDQMIPDGDFGSNVRTMLVSLSDRLRSLGDQSGVDLRPLDQYSGGSVAMVVMAFLAALALCLLGPLYLASRSERASHAHFYRLEGRR